MSNLTLLSFEKCTDSIFKFLNLIYLKLILFIRAINDFLIGNNSNNRLIKGFAVDGNEVIIRNFILLLNLIVFNCWRAVYENVL